MKTIYLIQGYDNSVLFAITSKRKAIKQMNIIKNAILSGKWFITKEGKNETAKNYEYKKEIFF